MAVGSRITPGSLRKSRMTEGAKLTLVRGLETKATLLARGDMTIRPTRVARPDTARKALKEASRLYRDARIGHIPTDEASRLAYVLKTVSDLVDRADIEPRLDALEQRLLSLSAMLERGR